MKAAILLAIAIPISAQTKDSRPTFDVAAIKPARRFAPIRALPGGRLTATVPLLHLIETAYSVLPFLVAGGPDWIKTQLFEIDAKVEGNPSKQEQLLMLQTLLEDRFQLKLHREPKDVPVYALVATKNGPRLTAPKDPTCANADPTTPLVDSCGRIAVGREMSNGIVQDSLVGGPVNTAEFVRALSRLMKRPVLDRTGFKGTFDIELRFTPDQATSGPPDQITSGSSALDQSTPTIFTALQEKLGLKLESTKGLVEILVIDRAEKTAGN